MNVLRFRQLMHAVLFAGPAVAACSEDKTEMPERAACVVVSAASRYSSLTTSPDVDGIAFVSRVEATFGSFDDAGSTSAVRTDRLPTLGKPCARATDPQACAARVAGLLNDPASAGWSTPNGPCGRGGFCGSATPSIDVAVISAGDDVRLATFDDLFAAVSPIETREEAAAVLLLRNGDLDCDGTNNVRPESDGWIFKRTYESCDGEIREVFWRVTRTGAVSQAGSKIVEEGDDSCVEGRRPPMLARTNVPWLSSLAACFAEIAHMEAAAVLAFDQLDRQLQALDAPWALRMRAHRARADEIEHAAITSALARRFGGKPAVPRVEGSRDPRTLDTLFRLALENAGEGCVREAYGALVAAHQARHASDAGVRGAFARIAQDEADHAELSFALDAWLQSRLSVKDRLHVERAKAQAWRDLAVACAAPPSPEVVRVAGMPSAARARALLAELHAAAHAA